MAITVTDRLTETTSGNLTTYTTGSVSAPATDGSPIILCITNSYGTNRTVSTVTGLGLNWTSIILADQTGANRAALWQGLGTASAGTVDIAFSGGCTGAGWSFLQCAGADKTTPVVGSNFAKGNGSGTTATATLGTAVTAGNTVIGVVTKDSASGWTNALGFTMVAQTWTSPTTVGAAMYNTSANSTTVSAATTGTGNWTIAGVEIAAAPPPSGEVDFMGSIPL